MSFAQFLKYTAAAVIVVALGYWLTLPSDAVAVDPNCQVVDLDDQVSELVHPRDFWLAQRDALRENREVLERLQATASFASEPKGDKIETPIERRMDRLSERLAQQSGSQEAQKARLERIAWMTKCETIIAGRLEQ